MRLQLIAVAFVYGLSDRACKRKRERNNDALFTRKLSVRERDREITSGLPGTKETRY